MSFNFLSPFGVVSKYETAPRKGIFVRPASDSAPGGWTITRDDLGRAELPGSPSSAAPYRLLGRKNGDSGEWNSVFDPGTFFYGEIDWRGFAKSETKPRQGSWGLSFHGPNSRHFASDAFTYGTSELHNNIYYEGFCIAVAPFPVLGACLKVVPATEGHPASYHVIAVCKGAVGDAVYRKRVTLSGVLRNGYTDEYRAEQMAMYDEKDNPDGWFLLGEFSLLTGSQGISTQIKEARTPWFFNASGTKAVCARECEVTLQQGSSQVTQSGYNVFEISVSDDMSSVSVADKGNLAGYNVSLTVTVTQYPNYENITSWPTPDHAEFLHIWEHYNIQSVLRMTGEYIVGVDFRGDEYAPIICRADKYRLCEQTMYYGVDESPHPEYDPQDTYMDRAISNANDVYGDLTHYYSLPPAERVEEGAGRTMWFVKLDDKLLLDDGSGDIHWIYRRLSGTESEFQTGVRDPNNTALYFTYTMAVFPHFWDVRTPNVAAYIEQSVIQGLGQIVGNTYTMESVFHGESDTYEKITEKNTGTETYEADTIATWKWSFQRLFDDYMRGTQEFNVTVIDGLWPTDYLNGLPSDIPNHVEFHDDKYYAFDLYGYSIPELLQSISKSYRQGGIAVDCFGNKAMSFAYKDHEGETRYYNYLSDGSVEGTTSAEGENFRCFPLGAS